MKTIDRYIIRELIPPLCGGLGVILFVLILDFILDILNLIIAKGVPTFTVARLFIYNLAWMLSLAMPMAALVSSLMAFGRLSGDKEIIASKALGIPFWRMMLPAAFVMLLLSVVMIIFGDIVLPEANLRAKTLMVSIHRKKPLTVLRPRVFIDDFPNIVLYMERSDDRTGKIYGVTLYEKRKAQPPRIIVAPEGDVQYDAKADAITFKLYNGEIHDVDREEPTRYTRAEFSKQVINIGDLGTKLGQEKLRKRGDRELNIEMLRNRIAEFGHKIDDTKKEITHAVDMMIDSVFIVRSGDKPRSRTPERRALLSQRKFHLRLQKYVSKAADAIRRKRKLSVELQKKYSLPLACIVFLLVGAPVGAWARRGGIGMAVGLSFGFFLLYWSFLIGGEELADRGIVSPAVGMWSGNVLMMLIGLFMLYRVSYESRFSGFGLLTKLLQKRKKES